MQAPDGLSTRERILWAAATMLGDDAGAALSVRAVAARAGVSTGSLRHHFRTQRDLMDAVLTRVYDHVLPDDSIHDTTIPAKERLLATLQRILAPEGVDIDPRSAWVTFLDRYMRGDPSDAATEELLAIEREMQRRIEYALTVLCTEGALARGDNSRRTRLLWTVLGGASLAQALPTEVPHVQRELDVLRAAVDAIFATPL